MPNVIFTTKAKRDLAQILRSVSEYTGHESTAIKLNEEIFEKIGIIQALPRAFRLQSDGNRQVFCRGYRIVFREIEGDIHILTIIHCSRKYP